jgi:saccharopine dehydrogenase-like NADP-dependent oxidoreductase
MEKLGCGCVVAQTAYNPVMALELIAKGKWQGAGVLGPECFDPDEYIRLADEYEYYMGIMEMDSDYKSKMNQKNLLEIAGK